MTAIHVVTGAGPVGSTVALQLADSGQQVRLLTRSGSGPDHPLIERRQVDVSRADQLDAAFSGAAVVHHCIHGSAYDARAWRAELPAAEQVVLDAAGRIGAVVVFPESLYSYGPVDSPMIEDLPRKASTGKLGVRTDLLAQREASPTPTVSVAASDFYGPRVLMAHAGDRMIPTVLAGRTMRV
ncbi:MAG: NAD-dependent epimerase/dehydratase family protein, partial [Nocardioides sp.]|uniref:NAD-dependent epimerase/dehydratase family protein n=1 Tax=Nocardioides sp. TaxID=35761 RepID=UPI0032648316